MHQIARSLVTLGWKVAFLSAPISLPHLLHAKKNQLKARYRIYKSNGKYDLNNNLWAYVPGAILTHNNQPLFKSRWLQNNWSDLCLPNLKVTLEKHDFGEADLILVDFIDYAILQEMIPHKKFVYRIADNNLGFHSFTKAQYEKELEFVPKADLVIYSALNLKRNVQKLNPSKSLYFPNGVNFHHFQGKWEIPKDLALIRRPIIIYVGAINYWFDFRLIEFAAKSLPQFSFVLIGPDHEARKNLGQIENLYILGSKAYSEIPAYLSHSDLGMIPFNQNDYPELVNSLNPLKLYEYLACGLPVLATAWDDINIVQ